MDHDITSHVVSTVRSFDKHSAATTISDVHTTVVTTTYCNENECSVSPVTTGVSYFTTIVHGTKTTYTTYCPLSTMIETVSSEIASSIDTTNGPNSVSIVSATDNIAATSSIKTFTVNAPAESTVNVITNNILTQTKTVSAVSTPGSSIKTQSTAIISSFEGAAARAFPAAIVLPFIYFLL
ncbi:hypothetical protein METBIDRAFT_38851 [Metschnikowia bicuspidata var. bicuspidata NRRL YB-4993]|uniref:Uncharacterized protein n=1 Tax=Metschnikowia bicuspidata var. bicuspidata NRRL YB-4993 TaxID=869754 RepID=A0A1A0HEB0_9ASCO|nr:hypothetical protein METBIDRAFT_38851 [Metschnikowia bicuspidata var. bicuspidata NRRL YB-4993]OBA22237.1 hypothetical protein METBIDRAFT_38851 [Metschnikowia bicuspidata var. bicuspidata NRRL YB-4993]